MEKSNIGKEASNVEKEKRLVESISSMEKLISTAGLTEEDLKIFQERLNLTKERLDDLRQEMEIERKIIAYEKLKSEIDCEVSNIEQLAENLSTQQSIEALTELLEKVNLTKLLDKDKDFFVARVENVEKAISEAQRKNELVLAYQKMKEDIEKEFSKLESLVDDELPAQKSENTAVENTKEDDPKAFFIEKPEASKKEEADNDLVVADDHIEKNDPKASFVEEPEILETKAKATSSDNVLVENYFKKRKNPLNIKLSSNFIYVAFIFLVLISYGYSFTQKTSAKSVTELKNKTEEYIKNNLVQPGTELKITDFAKDGDLYKFTVEVGGQKIVSYLTGDGKKLLLNPIDLDGKSDSSPSSASQAQAPSAEASVKKDVPEVELFVMSYCPYGVQAEKGILPVIKTLGSKIDFSVKFVDYTLHGKKEFDENLNQYCIQKEEPQKYDDYLACFAENGDSKKCSETAKINKAQNAACISATDKQYKLTENFSESAQTSPFSIDSDLNKKYGVQGSPSLVVNGQLLEAGRDSASLLKTICSGFNNQPAECKEELSSVSPKPGFGK